MKKIILFVVVLCVCAVTVLATDNNISIYSFNAYADSETVATDWDDGEIRMAPGQTLEVTTRFENEWNASIEVYMKGTLELTSDLVRDKTVILEEGQKKSVVLSYYVPTDLKDGTYPLDVYYTFYTNNSSIVTKKSNSWDVIIKKKVYTEQDICVNMSNQVTNLQATINSLNSNMTLKQETLTACVVTRDSCLANLTNLQDFKSLYLNQTVVLTEKTSQLSTCIAERGGLHTDNDIELAKQSGKNEQQSSDNMLLLLVVVVGGGYIIMEKRKRQVGGTDGKDPLRKGESTFNTSTPWRRK